MANRISLLRVVLGIYVIYLLYQTNPASYISAFFLTIFVILLDGIDGWVARQLHEESKLGSVVDILGDRIIENMFWITFAAMGWIGVWVPILVMSRGIVTDGIRGLAFAQGFTAFGEKTMAQSAISKFLTSSRFSRFVYAGAKVLAFVLMILVHIPNFEYWDPMTVDDFVKWLHFYPTLSSIAYWCVYIAVAMCVIRAIPVVLESKRFFDED